jgi:UDP-glucose 4-epimerase
LYAVSKRLGEAAVAAAVRDRRLDGRVVRFAGCYGPRMARTETLLVPSLIEAALNGRPFVIEGDGLQERWLSYVGDAVRALLLIGEHPKGALPAIDVGPEDALSVIAIAEVVASNMSHSPVFEYRSVQTAVPHRQPDVRRVRSLGWRALTPFRAGLQSTYGWFATESKLFV